ncbi:cyanophycinase [Flexibacter flexilis DSM 6793]|uniref:Cyanophycinase n=1 Tax=Flexibacter flexilis DSM 6793 TaxID=927664 RepID=A0A1I1I3I9_9BACT|nr:cyanophycinase [Flexibacter flexilis]SFC27780.1 cyanophycinase [Flexibacter flexilis DSM 6793]
MEAPKGKLIAIGGNVDIGTDEKGSVADSSIHFFEFGILQRILSEMKGRESVIEVITTASLIPEEIGQSYLEAFARLGCHTANVMHIKNRLDTANPEYLERIQKADGVLFTGGNQLRLSSIYGGTEILCTMQRRYQTENFLIAGTSAGAMAMSSTMIYEGESSEALFKGEVKISTGFDFISNVIIDTHFITRGRFGRLAQSVASNPACIGLGLGEDTGVLITNGNHLETIGSGLVLIFDGHEMKHTNIAELPEGFPISIEHLIVHVLAKGNSYLLRERAFIPTTELSV